jgi:hypothetical protein
LEAKKSNPGLWKRIVASVKASTKGGDPGEWSARKAQLAVLKYKKAGGGYSVLGYSSLLPTVNRLIICKEE